MARIAVIFGTTDGQTAKIARYLADILRTEGHTVTVVDTRAPLPTAPLDGAQAAVLAASVRMGKFQRPLLAFVRAHREALAKIPNLFLPVSLSASRTTPAAQREVRKTIVRFIDETGFAPGTIQPVAGALVYTRYKFFTKLALLLISKLAGGDTDTSRDYEYTDWSALSDLARKFGARLPEPWIVPDRGPGGRRADAAP